MMKIYVDNMDSHSTVCYKLLDMGYIRANNVGIIPCYSIANGITLSVKNGLISRKDGKEEGSKTAKMFLGTYDL